MGALLLLPQTTRGLQRKNTSRSTQGKTIINPQIVPRVTAAYKSAESHTPELKVRGPPKLDLRRRRSLAASARL